MRECVDAGTLADLMRRYPDEKSCERRLLEEAYPSGFACPAYGNRRCSKAAGRAHRFNRASRNVAADLLRDMCLRYVPLGALAESCHICLRAS